MADQLHDELFEPAKTVSGPLRLLAGVFGGGLALAGGVAVFVTKNSTGAASLVIAGAAIGVLALFADTIQSVKAGNFELVLVAARFRKAAHDAESKGRPEEARKLRDQADLLIAAAQPIASRLQGLRQEMSPGPQRTALMDDLVRMTRDSADMFPGDAAAIQNLFEAGTDGERIFAIGIMQGKPELATAQIAEAALKTSRSAFEQYHALLLVAELIKRSPRSTEISRLRGVIQDMLADGEFAEGSRHDVAQLILAMTRPIRDAH